MANMAQAVRMALHFAEENLGVTDVFGEDVGPPLGGVFTATQGLKTAWNSPLDERGIIGVAMGLAMAGQRPVAEIQFCDYIYNTIDLLKIAGNTCWCTNGDWNLPMVVKTPVGSGIRGSIYHSHSFDATATLLPALSDPGRVRFNTNAAYYVKIFSDLKWNVSFYGNWDNRPPAGFSGSDYGTSSGLSWTFGLK